MKKKVLIVILIVLIILLAIIVMAKSNFFQKDDSKDKNSESEKSSSSYSVNKSGENSGIYVGVYEESQSGESNENFVYLSIKIDKKSSKENQIKALISEISSAIGYKIDINSCDIAGDNIKIDFSKTAAPFELENSYIQTGIPKYSITSDSYVAKTIYDSITKTLKSYFGDTTDVQFSADNEDITY